MTKKRKLSSDSYDAQNVKRIDSAKQKITFLNGNAYPDNFDNGTAVDDGNCFFDSFGQALEQQKRMKVTVQQLRKDCKEFAQKNPPEWFINKINNDWHEVEGRFVKRDVTPAQYANSIESNDFWGRPDIEGRILCEKYGVKLHVIEESSYFMLLQQQVSNDTSGLSGEIQSAIMDSNSNKTLAKKLQEVASDEALKLLVDMQNFDSISSTHHLINSSGSLPLDKIDYNDRNTIHIVNGGRNHFEPLLDRKKDLTNQPQKLQQEQENHKLAEELQTREISSFMLNAFQENLDKKQPQEETKLQQEQNDRKFVEKLQQEENDHQLAKELQVDEILGYFSMPKNSFLRKEVQKTLDELLAKNPNKEIGDVIEQCTNGVKQHIKSFEERGSSNSRSFAERVDSTCRQTHQQRISHQPPQQLVK